MNSTLIARALRIGLGAVFLAGAAATATVPFWMDFYFEHWGDVYSLTPNYRLFLICFLIAVGLFGLWIVAELVLMLGTVARDPFVRRNALALRRMGVAAIACGALFTAKCFVFFTLMTLLCAGVLVLCGLFSLTLSGLFARAAALKEDNDLTI